MFANLPRSVWALLLITFVGSLGFTITLPLMPYYAAEFGADPLMVGLLSAAYAACALIAGPIFGRLSDRHGRRPWLLLSQVGTLLGFVITALGGSLAMLFLGRIIDGASAGNQVIAQAYVADVSTPGERTRIYGLMGAAFGLGAIVGPLLGGSLSQFGYSLPFWVAAAISALTFVITWAVLPEPSRRPANQARPADAWYRIILAPRLRRLFALYSIMALTFGLFVASIGLYMQLQLEATPVIAGLMVGYYGITSVVMQIFLVGRIARWLGEARMATIALAVLIGAMSILGLATTIPSALAGVTLLVIGMALLRPAVTSLISQAAGPEQQGSVMGVNMIFQSLADIATPLISGALIASGALGAPFFLAAVIALCGLPLLLRRLPAAPLDEPLPTPSNLV